jgi:hypothetical protein
MPETEYPEHDKMKAIVGDSQTIGEFLEWLQEEGFVIAHWGVDDWDETLLPDYISIERRLAAYFDIDLGKINVEKESMIEELRRMQDA